MKFEYSACPLCEGGDYKALGTRRSPDGDRRLDTTVVRCRACGFLYPNPMPRFTHEELQQNFANPAGYFPSDAERRLEPFERILKTIEEALPGKGSLLDVGCGRGELLYVARKMGWDAVGTDISEAFVDYAKGRFGVNAIQGDLEAAAFEPESFDAVSLISVIQYVQNPMGTLRRVYSLLKEDGVLFIEVTNEDALIFAAGDLFKSALAMKRMTTRLSPLFPSYQMYGFNPRSLCYALRTAGFSVLNLVTCGNTGGGRAKGSAFAAPIMNAARKAIIFLGGVTGRGHLIICTAKKEIKIKPNADTHR